MADDILLLDGVRFFRYTPKSEKEFERIIVDNANQIFGENAIYLDIKKKISNVLGKGTIPDGYVLYLEEKRLVLVENELSSHPAFDHIGKQLAKFIGALQNYQSRLKLAEILKEYIEQDPLLRERAKKLCGLNNLYQFLQNDILHAMSHSNNYECIVIIERKTAEIETALSVLMGQPKLLEVSIYAREDAESVKALRFVPFIEMPTISDNNQESKKTTFPNKTPWGKADFQKFVSEICEGAKYIFWFVAQSDKPLHIDELVVLIKQVSTKEITTNKSLAAYLGATSRLIHRKYPDKSLPLWEGMDCAWYHLNNEMKLWTIEILSDFAEKKGLK